MHNFTTIKLSSEANRNLNLLKIINGFGSKSELLEDVLAKIMEDEHMLQKLGLTKRTG